MLAGFDVNMFFCNVKYSIRWLSSVKTDRFLSIKVVTNLNFLP